MKGVTRVVLVDPARGSGGSIEALLTGLGSIRLAEVCNSYEEAEASVERARPDLVVIDLDGDPDRAEKVIRSLTHARPGLAVLPASQSHDGNLILRTIRAGAREFLPLPTRPDDLAEVIDRLVQSLGEKQDGDAADGSRVLAVVEPSGGVGCTTIATNVAATLARDTSREVVLVDFDLLNGAVDVCLDLMPEQTVVDVARVSGDSIRC